MPPDFLLNNGVEWNAILKANGFEEQFSELNYHFDLSENIQFHHSSLVIGFSKDRQSWTQKPINLLATFVR